ncbi:hypothetical protein BGZ98_002477 [Dissophora globulifera]|nr:hypothetical protein BGZ98_002477 [Dissophora globulifera]
MPVTYTKPENVTDAAAVKSAYKPTHPGLFEVVYAEGEYNSRLVASRSYAKGELLCKIEGTTLGPKRYTTVQVGESEHIELNSDLVFMNHSCSPTVSLDTDTMTIVAVVDLKEGDNLTFFYPSSEWEMDQPFPCWCGSEQCVKNIQGAKFLSKQTMSRYFITKHIQELLNKRDDAAAAQV